MTDIQTTSPNQSTTYISLSQCTTDFSSQISEETQDIDWLSLFPQTEEITQYFLKLAEPLLVINAPFWDSANRVIESSYRDKCPILSLQHYDQGVLFGHINQAQSDQATLIPGEIFNYSDGVLILHISPLLVTPKLWFLLKGFLLTQTIATHAPVNANKQRTISTTQFEQQLSTKIILVATRYQLDELTQLDPDFSQIKILFSELPGDIKSTQNNIWALQKFIQDIVKIKKLSPLTTDALNTLFIHLSRLCEHQNKLLFCTQTIASILECAQLMLNQAESNTGCIDSIQIKQAISIYVPSNCHAQQFSDQAIIENQLKIQLQGKCIGQINGLSVIELLGYPTEFGEIFRISASDMIGDGEIVDIERKVELGGNVHAKGTLIVQGYLNHFFTHIANFPFSCNLVFEQSYQESDGDSASLAILLAVSSCYSQLEIAQNLFVTGALDQHGNVLPIGGINQKIEAITRLFTLGKIDQPVTVIMPVANQIHLLLNQDTLALISTNKITIHAIEHCVEAFPMVLGKRFEKVLETINKRIQFLHKDEEDDARQSLVTKCLNWLR